MQYGQPTRSSYRLRLSWLECLFFSCAMLLAGVMVLEGTKPSGEAPGYKVQMARLKAEEPVVASTDSLQDSVFFVEPAPQPTID